MVRKNISASLLTYAALQDALRIFSETVFKI